MDWNELFLQEVEDVHVKAFLSLQYTSYHYDKLLNTRLKPFGISHEQYNILKLLSEKHPDHYSLKDIQLRLINQTPNTTRLVEKLRKKDLLTCTPNPDNRRQLHIKISKRGQELIEKIEVPFETIREQLRLSISDQDAQELIRILSQIQKMVENASTAES